MIEHEPSTTGLSRVAVDPCSSRDLVRTAERHVVLCVGWTHRSRQSEDNVDHGNINANFLLINCWTHGKISLVESLPTLSTDAPDHGSEL